MKLLSSIKKELILAARSFYFYIEIGFALIMLAVLLFAVPEHSGARSEEYLYLDLPPAAAKVLIDETLDEDIDGRPQETELKAEGAVYKALLFQTDERDIFLMESEAAAETMTKHKKAIGAVITMDKGELHYKYFLQGYESKRLKNLLLVLHAQDFDTLETRMNEQKVINVDSGHIPLNDRENAIPPLMAFSGSLMSMFIMAAYVSLDRQEGVIKAFAVTASPVSKYLISKMFVLMLTSVISGLIVVAPLMGTKINYALLLLLLLTTGVFASMLGLLTASFFQNITKAFGIIFLPMVLFMLPAIAYYIPGWDPVWVKLIPSYPMLQGFKEIISNGDAMYVLLVSAGFLAAGFVLFLITNNRFRKTLTV
ncbi:MAG: ABC-2 family transporter protein [Firmicutes bacterium ADurb.Bin182]|nr:MAG: ABC-2 family transporter protein [Firmicutes bacterium ADurb.Bin182]